jgi:hypothetical protein
MTECTNPKLSGFKAASSGKSRNPKIEFRNNTKMTTGENPKRYDLERTYQFACPVRAFISTKSEIRNLKLEIRNNTK